MWIKALILLVVVFLFCAISFLVGYERGYREIDSIIEETIESEIEKIKMEAKEEHYLTD